MNPSGLPFTLSTIGGGGLGGSGGSRGGASNNGGPCGACKFLRRKCVPGCIFAPYFSPEQGAAHFAAVHRVFGASNVSKLLLHMPVHCRLEAVSTICYEAHARLRDPVYGCVSHIMSLHQQVANLQAEIQYLQAHRASLQTPPTPPPQPMMMPPPAAADHTSVNPPYFEIQSAAFDHMNNHLPQQQPQWVHPSLDPPQFVFNLDGAPLPPTSDCGANAGGGFIGGDCACTADAADGLHQMLANEFFHRQC